METFRPDSPGPTTLSPPSPTLPSPPDLGLHNQQPEPRSLTEVKQVQIAPVKDMHGPGFCFRRQDMLPPGPEGHRIVGSLPGYKGPKTNLQWAKQYGAIYRVNMAGKHIVYLNTIQLVEKYLDRAEGEKYLGRPPGPAAIGEGLLFGNGEKWVKNKAAFMKALNTDTFIPALESVIEFELGILIPILQAKNGRKMLVANVLLEACVNVIMGLLRGSSLPERDRQRRQVLLLAKRLARCNLASPLTQISLEH